MCGRNTPAGAATRLPTVSTMPGRFAAIGDPHAGIEAAAGSLEKLLEHAARDEAHGLGDAPWPPHFRKVEGEGVARCAIARERSSTKTACEGAARRRCQLARQGGRARGARTLEGSP